MSKPTEKDTKEAKQKKLAELRSMVAKIAVAVLTVSGWLFLFMNGPQSVPTPSPEAQKQAAQDQKATGRPAGMKADQPEGTFVMSYSLVLLSVGLGLMFVTGASNRRDRAHNQQYEGMKVTADEEG